MAGTTSDFVPSRVLKIALHIRLPFVSTFKDSASVGNV